MIHDLNLTINYWLLLLEQSAVFSDFHKTMSIIVVHQIASGFLLFSLVNPGLTIRSMYSSVFIAAVCYVEKGGEPIFLGETEGVIIKTGYIY